MKGILDFICNSDSGKSNITINTSIYSIEAIHSAAHQFTGNYHVLVTMNSDNTVTVIFESKRKTANVIEDLKEFTNSLMDHQVRLNLDKNYGKIRDLIVAHAFSPLDLKKETKDL